MNSLFKNLKLKIRNLAFFAILVIFLSFAKNVDASFRMPSNNLGLVGYWALNDGSGTKATDYSGNGNTGTLTNGAFWGAGKRGGSLACDGTNDYASTTYTPSGLTDFTISAWINTGANSTEFPVSSRDASAANGIFILYENNGSGIEVGFSNAGNLTRKRSNTSLDVGVWHHVVGTHAAGATSMTLYIDGVSTGVSAESAASNPGNSGVLTFCRDGSSSTPLYFSGFVDDARVYSRALTGTEVTALYNSGVTKLREGSANGLVGHWKLDDASGTKATDSSGNNRTGTLTGGVTWTAGKRGTAVTLNGTSGYISAIPNLDASAGITNTLSVSTWVKRNTFGVSGDRVILGRTNGSFGLVFTSADKLQCTKVGIDSCTASSTGISDTNWHHVVLTLSGTTATYYIDGVSAGGGGAYSSSFSSSGGLYDIGSRNGDIFFNGSYDEMRVYNRALTATEVTTLYNSGAVTRNASTAGRGGNLTSGLVGHWTFDGSKLTTTTATDSSGSANSGTLTNGPVPIQGKLGQALSFDGVNDYVSVGDALDAQLTNNNPITFSGWVYVTSYAKHVVLVSKYQMPFATYGHQWIFEVDTAGKLTTALYDTNGVGGLDGYMYRVATPAIPLNQWTHVATTYDGGASASGITLYINGASVAASTANSGSFVRVENTDAPLELGRYSDGTSNAPSFFGSLDDVRIYNRALTAAEVLQLYNLR